MKIFLLLLLLANLITIIIQRLEIAELEGKIQDKNNTIIELLNKIRNGEK